MSRKRERGAGWTGRDQSTMTQGPGTGGTAMEAGTQLLVGMTMITGLVVTTMGAMATTGGEVTMTTEILTGGGDGVMTAITIRNCSMTLLPFIASVFDNTNLKLGLQKIGTNPCIWNQFVLIKQALQRRRYSAQGKK